MYRSNRTLNACLTRSVYTCVVAQSSLSHYEALGLNPKATQSEIKSAYYKLSMQCHPDKSETKADVTKFRVITEAYEVLGNIKLKKLYDKGLIVSPEGKGFSTDGSIKRPEPEELDPALRFYKGHGKRHVVTIDGRTPIFDFDAWSREHYNETFERSQRERAHLTRRRDKLRNASDSVRTESHIYVVFALFGALLMMATWGIENHDQDRISRKKPQMMSLESAPTSPR